MTENKVIENKTIIQHINEKLLLKPMSIQLPQVGTKQCKIMKADIEGIGIYFENFFPPGGRFLITGFVDESTIELEIEVKELIQESFFLCNATYLRISSQRRSEPRYLIQDAAEFYIRKISISRTDIKIDRDHVPISFEIIMARYQKEKSFLGDEVIIQPFKTNSILYQEVKKTGKSVYVEDLRNDASQNKDDANEDIISLKNFYGYKYEIEKKSLIDKNIISFIICPLFANVSNEYWIPIGYIEVRSKTPLDMTKLMEIKTLSFEILNTFLDMSVVSFKERIRVLDVSKSGLSVEISHPELITMMLHRDQFNFEIIIRHQAPITMKGLICSKKQISDKKMNIGVKIIGLTERPEQFKRYLEYIAMLEKSNKPATQ